MTLNLNLSIYIDSIVKLILEKNSEVPYIYGNLICYLRYDEGIKQYVLNHPIDEKTGKCQSGESGFDPSDIKFLRPANEEETMAWIKEYVEFHNSVVEEKGYDPCEVDIYKVLPNVTLGFK